MIPGFPTQTIEEIRGLVTEKDSARRRTGHFRFLQGGVTR